MDKRVFWGIITCILIFGFTLRKVYLSDLVESGHAPVLNESSDSQFFFDWSTKISEIGILFDASFHPMNMSDKSKLRRYFPQLNDEAILKIWNSWFGNKTYHQAPAYPYFLAGIFHLYMKDVMVVYVLQALLGVCTMLLIVLLAKRLFGEATAIASALFYCFYGTFIIFESTILRVTILTFLNVLLIYLLVRHQSCRRFLNWWIIGSIIGIMTAFKASNLLLILLIPPCVIFLTEVRADRFRVLAGMILGFITVLMPILVRNFLVGVPVFSFSSVGPITFLVPNHVSAIAGTGWRSFPEDTYDILIMSQGKMTEVIKNTYATHPDIISIIKLYFGKFICFWHPDEINNQYILDHNESVMRFLKLSFRDIIGLAGVGVYLSKDKLSRHWSLILIIAVTLLVCMIFYNLSRFRLPILPFILIYAAFGFISILSAIKSKAFKKVFRLATAVILVSFGCHVIGLIYQTKFII